MSKSIIQHEKECLICREEADKIGYYEELPNIGLHKHHLMHGTANKKLAEEDGLWAYVCQKRHHQYGQEAPHVNAEVDRKLKKIAQEAFESRYGHDAWMNRYKKNFITDTE